jgi:predicted lactoylglutathione lyase
MPTCMIVSDEASVMLLTRERFKDFTRKAIGDTATSTDALIALTATSGDEVDPDGHHWEVFYMDPSAASQ